MHASAPVGGRLRRAIGDGTRRLGVPRTRRPPPSCPVSPLFPDRWGIPSATCPGYDRRRPRRGGRATTTATPTDGAPYSKPPAGQGRRPAAVGRPAALAAAVCFVCVC